MRTPKEIADAAYEYLLRNMFEPPEKVAEVVAHFIPGTRAEDIVEATKIAKKRSGPGSRKGLAMSPAEREWIKAFAEDAANLNRRGKALAVEAINDRTLREYKFIALARSAAENQSTRCWTVEEDMLLLETGSMRADGPDGARYMALCREISIANHPALENAPTVTTKDSEEDRGWGPADVVLNAGVEGQKVLVWIGRGRILIDGDDEPMDADAAEKLASALNMAAGVLKKLAP